jgi:hypothetical protein
MDTNGREDGKTNRRWTQIYADFDLGFDYASDQWSIPSNNVSDFPVIIDSKT